MQDDASDGEMSLEVSVDGADEEDRVLSLNDILQCITGLSNKPVAAIRGNIIFKHETGDSQSTKRRIEANTCGLDLTIFVNEQYLDCRATSPMTFLIPLAWLWKGMNWNSIKC